MTRRIGGKGITIGGTERTDEKKEEKIWKRLIERESKNEKK